MIMVDLATMGRYYCYVSGRSSYYTAFGIIRIIVSFFSALVLLYLYSQAGESAFGYKRVREEKKLDNLCRYLRFNGKLANILIDFFFFTQLITAVLFISNYQDSDSKIKIDIFLGSFGYVFGVFSVYFVLRVAYFFLSKHCRLAYFESVSDENPVLIYREDVKAILGPGSQPVINVLLGLSVWGVIIAASANIILYVFYDGKINFKMIFLIICFIVNSIKHLCFSFYCFKQKKRYLRNGFINFVLLVVDSTLCFLFISDENFSIIAVACLFSAWGLNLLLNGVSFFVNHKAIKTQNKLIKTDMFSVKKVESLICILATFTVSICTYVCIFILIGSVTSEKGDFVGSLILWCKDLVNDTKAKTAMMRFKPDNSQHQFMEILFCFIFFDALSIVVVFFTLIIFPRKLPSSADFANILRILTFLLIATKLRLDALSDSMFFNIDLGHAVIVAHKGLLKDFQVVISVMVDALLLFAMILALKPTNIIPTDGSLKERLSYEQKGVKATEENAQKCNFATVVVLVIILPILYLMAEAQHKSWGIAKPKDFDEDFYTQGLMMTTTNECTAKADMVGLSGKVTTFVKEVRQFNEKLFNPIHFFEDSKDRFAFMLPSLISLLYLIFNLYLNFSKRRHIMVSVLLLFWNFLGLINLNVTSIIFSVNVQFFPGVFYEMVIGSGYKSLLYCIIATIVLQVYVLYETLAPATPVRKKDRKSVV